MFAKVINSDDWGNCGSKVGIRDGKLVDKVVDDAVIRRHTQLNSFAKYFWQRVVRVLSVE